VLNIKLNINDRVMRFSLDLLTGYRIAFVLGSEITISHIIEIKFLMDRFAFGYVLLLLMYVIALMVLLLTSDWFSFFGLVDWQNRFLKKWRFVFMFERVL